MQDEQGLATAATRRLPPQALASLREAFADEFAERLPRLRTAVLSGEDALLQQAVRDAHSLASSGALVGEAGASRAARAAETLLVGRPLGGAVPAELPSCLDELSASLSGWRP